MKQLLVLSGKGGTGKTTIVAAFIQLLNAKAFADCDVDAPNLHLVTSMKDTPQTSDYYGLDKAFINENLCVTCGDCMKHCQFDAITYNDNTYNVNPYKCEGCSVCEAICPVDAITMNQDIAGKKQLYSDKSIFSTATLKMGSGTSGKLVTEVKKALTNQVKTSLEQGRLEEDQVEIGIIDGSPGIGCPVISSITGVDLILVVTEPTVSGISDMKRVIEIANHFNIQVAICTNKYDINETKTDEIRAFAKDNNHEFVGVIPYDSDVALAINQGINVMETSAKAGRFINNVFNHTIQLLR